MTGTPADARQTECNNPPAPAPVASPALSRLSLLLVANLAFVAGALLTSNYLLASSKDFNPANSVFMACGVLDSAASAAAVCEGLIIAFAIRSTWIGCALAILYGVAHGCIHLGGRFFGASATQLSHYHQEWIAEIARDCLHVVAAYALASLIGLWWRPALRLLCGVRSPDLKSCATAESRICNDVAAAKLS